MAINGDLFSQSDWRKNLIHQLHRRNREQSDCFNELITSHNRLFDNWTAVRHENLQLSILNEKLRLEGGSNSGSTSVGVSDARVAALEQKLMSQQEELTELHKRRGENAQLLVDLNNTLKEKETQIKALEERLSQTVTECIKLRAEIELYKSNNQNLEELNLHLKDEHQALHLEFVHIEEKLRNTQDENTRLLDTLKKYKSKDAEKLNEENENFLRHMSAKMQKELEDAAKDTRGLSPEQLRLDYVGPVLSATVVPTKAHIKFDAHDGEVNAVRWSPVDKILATGGADRKVKLWDVSKGILENKGMLVGSNAGIMSVDFDSTGSLILGASNDFATRVWTVSDQRLRHTLTGHSGKVMAAKFLGEPTKVVTGSHDRTLKIWDLRGRACQQTKFAGSSCNDLVTSDGAGTTIISGHFDKKIRFWDTRTEKAEHDIQVQGKVTSLDLSRDAKYLLCCVRDDTLRVIELRTNQIIHTFSHDCFKVSCDWARAVFSFECNHVAVGSNDGSVFIWNILSNKVEATLKDEHTAAVTAVAWHPLGNFLGSVDRNKKVVVWADL